MNNIKVGDKIRWCGTWGYDSPKAATILSIELCEREGQKEGKAVKQVRTCDKDRCVFDLDNGHWAYGHQIDIIKIN